MNHVRYQLAGLCLRLWLLALAAVPLTSHAASWNKNTDLFWDVGNGNIVAFPGQGSGNVWTNSTVTPTNTGPKVTGPTKALPFNPSPKANFSAKFLPRDMAKGMMSPLSAAVTLIGFYGMKKAMDASCVRIFGGSMQLAPGGQWEECRFTSQPVTEWKVSGLPEAAYRSSQSSACMAWTQYEYGWLPNVHAVYTPPSGASVVGDCTLWGNDPNNYYQRRGFDSRQAQSTVQDGWQPVTPQAVEDKLTNTLTNWTQCDFLYGYAACEDQSKNGSSSRAVLNDIMNSGGQVELAPASVGVSGETSKQGSPVTSQQQNPDGTSKTVTTTNNYSYTYAPATTDNRVAITQTTTTTTNSTTVNNTTNQTTTSTEVVTKTEEPQKDPCDQHPDRAGCAPLGTPDNPPTLNKQSKDVTITAAVFTSGSCPSAVNFSALGRAFSFEYTPLCDRLSILKPLFLMIAGVIAAYIFANGLKI